MARCDLPWHAYTRPKKSVTRVESGEAFKLILVIAS